MRKDLPRTRREQIGATVPSSMVPVITRLAQCRPHGRGGGETVTMTLAVAIPGVKVPASTWRYRPCDNDKATRKTMRVICASVTLQKQTNRRDIALFKSPNGGPLTRPFPVSKPEMNGFLISLPRRLTFQQSYSGILSLLQRSQPLHSKP
jgi:hypothetical protein